MARATRPLNKDAVKKADDEFYANHPELVEDGKRVPLSATAPSQKGLRSEWMQLYEKNGGEVEGRKPAKKKPDDPVQPCPLEDDESTSIPATPPKDCKDSPETIKIPSELNDKFDDRWDNSFPGGTEQEEGGTLIRDKDGNLQLINTNPAGRNGDSFPADRNIPDDAEMVGVFHTHPYDEGDTDISLSGGDAAYMINEGDPVIIAQSGEGQFMYVRTEETPNSVDFDKLNDEQNARVQELVNEGKDFDEASQIAAKETAQANGLAYYEGKDGEFERVSC